MNLKLVTAATEEPVSLEEFKQHLKLDLAQKDENADLAIKLLAARRHVENSVLRGRALVTSTWKLTLECWCGAARCYCGRFANNLFLALDFRPSYIELPLGNLQSAAVTYRLSDGSEQAFTDFRLERTYTPAAPTAVPPVTGDADSDAGIGRLYLAYGKSWPSATLDVGEPISIAFTAGWDGAENVPGDIKLAIMMLAAHWYRNREAVTMGTRTASAVGGSESTPLISTPLALAVDSLCSPYVDRRF